MKAIITTILALFIGVQFMYAQDKTGQPAKDANATKQTVQPAPATQTTPSDQPTKPAQQTTVKQEQQTQPAKATQQTQTVTATPAANAAAANPKLVAWNETTHNFGKVKQNDPTTVTFTFTNNGETPVVVTAARSSCGCTVAEYTKEPVKPGATGTVKATYNSARVGSFTKTVSVTFEGNATPDVLTIKGEVEGISTPPPAEQNPPAPTAQPAETPKK